MKKVLACQAFSILLLVMIVAFWPQVPQAQERDEFLEDLGSVSLDLQSPSLGAGTDEGQFVVRALLEPVQSAVLSSEMNGKITRLHKKNGQSFLKGDRLVTFECRGYEIERGRLKAKLNSAELIYENALQLESLNSIGVLDVSLAEAETHVAKAELSAAHYTVSRCAIAAPFDGRVIEVARKQHEWINIGDPLMEIFNDKDFLLKMLIPSDWLVWLKLGTPFEVNIDETGKQYSAKIMRIGARIDPVSRSVTVHGKIDDNDAAFIHSMSGNASFAPPSES